MRHPVVPTIASYRSAAVAALLWLSVALPATAAVITVGTPVGAGQCTCGTIQCAFDHVNSLNGSNEVRLTRSLTYWGEHDSVQIDDGEELTITGGYATCGQAVADALATTVSGAGGGSGPVLRITAGAGGIVNLRKLTITGGSASGSIGYGGGIHFSGAGTLDIRDATIAQNSSDFGGGIYARGTSDAARLIIGANVQILNNTALAGGGVAVAALRMVMNQPGSTIALNQALRTNGSGGHGGGLYVTGYGGRAGHADIGTAGLNGIGALYSNTAVYGGGAAVVANDGADDNGAFLTLHSTNASAPTAIRDNFASAQGGGVYLKGEATSFPTHPNLAQMQAGNRARIESNSSPEGAAAYMDYGEDFFGYNSGSALTMTNAVVTGNVSADGNGVRTDGAIIHVGDFCAIWAKLKLDRVELSGNDGGPLVRNDGCAELSNVLIADNIARSSVLNSIGSDGHLHLRSSTIAGNTMGVGSPVLRVSSDTLIHKSIIDQPGRISLQRSGGSLDVQHVVTSENASLGGNPLQAYQADPLFMDPDNGDYRLQAASPAVDRAPASGGLDLQGQPRTTDLWLVPNIHGAEDVGAYERSTVGNLARNSAYALALHLWPPTPGFQPNPATWLSDDSAVADGSGSVLVKLDPSFQTLPPDGRVLGPHQCINVPGPARYLLGGYGKSPGTIATRDYAVLRWRFFQNSAGCTGTPQREGTLTLPSGNAWAAAPAPAQIDVPPEQFGGNSRIDVTLVAVEGNVSASNAIDAYFDGITLTAVPFDDLIFADDFEP